MPTTIETLPNELLIKIFKHEIKNHSWGPDVDTVWACQDGAYFHYLKSRLMSNRLFGAARVAWWQTYTIILVHEHLSLRGHAVSVQGSPHNKEMMRRATAISFLIILKSKEHLASVCPQAKSLLIAELPLCTRATKLEVFIESQGGRLDSPSWMCEAVMSLIAEVEQVIGKQFQKSVFRHCAVGGPLDPDDEFAEDEFDLD